MKDGRAGGRTRGRANTAAIFVSAYLRHYFVSIFQPFLHPAVVKFECGKAHIAVRPDNGVGTAVCVKSDNCHRPIPNPEISFVWL
jgi:hypothetical protein